MNKITLLSLLLLSFLSANADAEPSLKSSLAAKKLLTDIVKVDDTLISVGDRGHILLSKDAKVWQQADVPVNVLLTDVYFLDKSHGWAVGHDATILATEDGGHTWTVSFSQPALDKPLFGIYFKDKQQGIAIGAYGLFLRTLDGGKTWQSEFHGEFLNADDRAYLEDLKAEDPEAYKDETRSILPHFNRLLVGNGKLYLAGETGLMASSDDFGVTWQKVDNFYNGSFFDISRAGDGELFIGGLRGNLFRSDDNGQNWHKVTLDSTASINRILTGENDKLVVVGNSGLLYASSDDGKTFKKALQSDGKAITGGVFFKGSLVLSSEVGIKVLDSKKLMGG